MGCYKLSRSTLQILIKQRSNQNSMSLKLNGTANYTSGGRPSVLSTIACCLFFCLPPASLAGTIEGVVFSETGPIRGATVFAYQNYEDLAAGRNFRKSEPIDRDGHYRLTLPAGSYYLLARANLEGRQLFSYHGVNPITVTNEYRWLPFVLVPENKENCAETPGQSRITGQVMYKGLAVSGGVVSVYPWQEGKFRGMGLLTNTLDENGTFSFDLEAGNYVVIARKKQDIKGIGPVKRGDMFCYPSTNPISVANNQSCNTDINCYPRDELDLFLNDGAINPQGRRHDDRRQASLHDLQPAEAQKPATNTPATLSGQISDPNGKPRQGMTVTAYPARGLDLFQMHALRLITGNMGLTDAEGRYKIALKDGDGKYYIVAREKVGEAPDRSEYYGLYEGSPNHSIIIDRGTNLTDINVVVDRIMPTREPDSNLENP